jgi:hypothetical protein
MFHFYLLFHFLSISLSFVSFFFQVYLTTLTVAWLYNVQWRDGTNPDLAWGKSEKSTKILTQDPLCPNRDLNPLSPGYDRDSLPLIYSRDSSVGIANGYGLDGRGVGVRRNTWIYTSTPPYVLMAWCLISSARGQLYLPTYPWRSIRITVINACENNAFLHECTRSVTYLRLSNCAVLV